MIFPVDISSRVVITLLTLSLSFSNALKDACIPTGKGVVGMTARFFPYKLSSQVAVNDPKYINGGYLNTNVLETTGGIVDPNLSYKMCRTAPNTYFNCPSTEQYVEYYIKGGYKPSCGSTKCTNFVDDPVGNIDIFGYSTYPSNFTVELTGYFLAPENGMYKFSLAKVDDAAAIAVGAGAAFDCCDQNSTSAPSGSSIDVNGIKPWGSDPGMVTANIYLAANNYYPVKLVYTNGQSAAVLTSSVELPDGTVITDWGNLVYSFPNEGEESIAACSAQTVSYIPYSSVSEIHSTSLLSSTTTPSSSTSSLSQLSSLSSISYLSSNIGSSSSSSTFTGSHSTSLSASVGTNSLSSYPTSRSTLSP